MAFLEHRKNLAGMGLGALLGVLASWYIAPGALPFACLGGAIVGYGHDVVLCAIGQFVRNPRAAFAEPAQTLKSLSINRLHPMDLAYGVIVIAFMAVMSSVGFGVYEMWSATPDGLGFFANYAFLIETVAMTATAVYAILWLGKRYADTSDTDIRDQWRLFYTDWDRWNRGALGYFAAKTLEIARIVVAFGVTSSAVIGWYAMLVGPFLCAWFIVYILAALLCGIYQTAKSGGYWFCFAVALATAAPIAWLMYPYFENAAVLWLTAIVAAVFAGALGETLLMLLRWIFALSRRLDQFAATDFGDHCAAFAMLCQEASKRLYRLAFPDDGFVWGTIAPQPR